MPPESYLTIVVSASNADYGGAFLTRLQKFVEDKRRLKTIYGMPVDLIVVEWNPPPDRQRLAQAIQWFPEVPTQVVSVSRDVHERYYNPGKFSFLEYMAKNVGIRRALGKFVLSTNADVLFSMGLSQFLARQQLDESCFYRANRHDFDARGQVYQICYANGVFAPGENVVGKSKTGVPYSENMPHFNASGDFMLMSREKWNRLRAYPENTGYLITLDGEMVHIALTNGLKQVVLRQPLYHQWHTHSPVKPWYMPPDGWDDWRPRGTMNDLDDWGLRDEELEAVNV